MSKTAIIILVLFAVIAGGIFWIISSREKVSVNNSADKIVSPAPTIPSQSESGSQSQAETTISFGKIKSLSKTKTYSIPISIDTGNNNLIGVQTEIIFDPKIMSIIEIKPGSFFKNPEILFSAIDNSNGKISYALAVKPAEKGKNGKGEIAILTIEDKTKNPTQAFLSFTDKTIAISDKSEQSIVKLTVPAQFVLGQPE